jgi:hypothetical protein
MDNILARKIQLRHNIDPCKPTGSTSMQGRKNTETSWKKKLVCSEKKLVSPDCPLGSRSEVRGSRSEVRGPRSEVRGPRSEVRGPRSEVRGPRFEVRGPRFEVRGPRSEIRGSRPEVRDPRSEVRGGDVVAATAIMDCQVGPRLETEIRGPRFEVRDPRWQRGGYIHCQVRSRIFCDHKSSQTTLQQEHLSFSSSSTADWIYQWSISECLHYIISATGAS